MGRQGKSGRQGGTAGTISGQGALGVETHGSRGMSLRGLRSLGAAEPKSGARLGVLVIGTKRRPRGIAGARLGRDSLLSYQTFGK